MHKKINKFLGCDNDDNQNEYEKVHFSFVKTVACIFILMTLLLMVL